MTAKPVVLCILDGWGHREDAPDNAIAKADTPFWDKLIKNNPNSLLETSGLSVGLPDGQMGNSEVGHMNIGSGRIVMQSLPRIDAAIADGSIAKNESLTKLISILKDVGGVCHLMGLVSDGGVHSHQKHIIELARIVSDAGIAVKIHAFIDGRDVAPASAQQYIDEIEKALAGCDVEVATVSGRYYAMDRDNRWDRVELAYNAIVAGEGELAKSCKDAIKNSYDAGKMDEFVKPSVINGYKGAKDGDGVIMANFRADRAREILMALLEEKFYGFNRKKTASFVSAVGMVEYSDRLEELMDTIFAAESLNNTLGQVIAEKGMKQLRIAETEKYAHVTFFFNGGREDKYGGEERQMIQSPDVATYDMQPEMAAPELTDKLVAAIESGKFDLIVVNYANTDMVGHTGIQDAAVKAVETIDKCLAKLVTAVEKAGGAILISADHGNSEQMLDGQTGQPHTSHTTNPVPLIIAGKDIKGYKLKDGRLCDIAPTILKIMGIKQPVEMTGESLING